jgi:hypothetical protein
MTRYLLGGLWSVLASLVLHVGIYLPGGKVSSTYRTVGSPVSETYAEVSLGNEGFDLQVPLFSVTTSFVPRSPPSSPFLHLF